MWAWVCEDKAKFLTDFHEYRPEIFISGTQKTQWTFYF